MRREDPQNARAILAANVEKLVRRAGSQPALCKSTKVAQKTISRAQNNENAANLDTINDLAAGCGLHPWQLLVPGLDPDNPPSIEQQAIQSQRNERTNAGHGERPKLGDGAGRGVMSKKQLKTQPITLDSNKKKRGLG